MSDTIIKIDGLGKSYQIGSSHARRENYTALRDVLVEKAKSIADYKNWKNARQNTSEFWAIKDINLEIKRGEKLAIIGKNGAGKSTLLKILSRITAPTTGSVSIEGRVSSLLEVGTGFHPELTGRENIYLNGSILGMSQREIKQKFDEIVDFSGIEKFIDTPVKRFSSGMRTRLGFAIAAFLQNDILILDEVLAVGDAAFQKKCLGRMEEISHSQGRTILFVSHNLAAVQDLCDTGVLLSDGQILKTGHVDDCIMAYNELISGGGSGYFWSKKNEPSHILKDIQDISIEELSLVNKENAIFPGPYRNDNLPYFKINIGALDAGVDVGFLISDEYGQSVFASTCLDCGEEENPLQHDIDPKTGKACIKVKIPNHFLNEGYYRIYPLAFFRNGGSVLHPKRQNDLPYLDLTIQGGLSRSPFFQNKREGVNAPLLQWEKA